MSNQVIKNQDRNCQEAEKVIKIENLSVRFSTSKQNVDAVKNLSFSVKRGGTLAIVGKSGSGKSVTSLVLMRLVEQGGSKIINGSMLLHTHDGRQLDLAKTNTATMQNIRGADTVRECEASTLFANLKHAYTKALLAAVPQLGAIKGSRDPAKFRLLDQVNQADNTINCSHCYAVDYQTEPIPRVKDLVSHFDIHSGIFIRVKRRVHAIKHVSFDLYAGQTVALVGESGCGKSTTGHSLLELVYNQDGSIEFAGQHINQLTGLPLRQIRHHIQFIFQDPLAPLDPRMTIGISIMPPLLIHGVTQGMVAKKRGDWLLEQVGLLPQHAKRYPHEFSDGQRQRISIARALALNPKVVIADESVSALNVSIQIQIINLLLDLQQKFGIAFLYISHDMAVVKRISQRVALMYLGQIVEIGSRQNIFANPQYPYSKKSMATVPIVNPERRTTKRELNNDVIPSPIRRVGEEPLVRPLIEVSLAILSHNMAFNGGYHDQILS